MKPSHLIQAMLILLILSACGQKPAPGSTPDISGIQTAAVATVYASITKIPTAEPETPTPDLCVRTKSPTENLLIINKSLDRNSYSQIDENGLKTLIAEEADAGEVDFILAPDLKKGILLTSPQNPPETITLSGSQYTQVTAIDLDDSNRTPILNIDPLADVPPIDGFVSYRYIGKVAWSPTSDKILIFEYLSAANQFDDLDKLYLFDFSSGKLVLLAEQNARRAELAGFVFDGWSTDGKSLYFRSNEKYTILDTATLQEISINLSELGVGSLESPSIRAYLPETNQFLISGYAAPKGKHAQYYLVNQDGSGLSQITKHESSKSLEGWSPDHKKLFYAAYEIYKDGYSPKWHGVVNLETGQEITFDWVGFYFESNFSPDSQKIAAIRSGQPDSMIIFSFRDQTLVTTPVPNTGLFGLTWSPDSRDLFFPEDGKIKYFDTCEGKVDTTQLVFDGYVTNLVFKK